MAHQKAEEVAQKSGTREGLLRRLEQLNVIGAALSSEPSIDRLLESILLAAKAITHADGGTLYRVSEDRKLLRFEMVRTDSLGIACGGPAGQALSAAFKGDLPLFRANGGENDSQVATYSAIHARTVNIADAYLSEGFDFSGTRKFDQMTGYRSQSFLTVPMRSHEGEVIGVLQLINAIDPATGTVGEFSPTDQGLAESLASQAAVALTNRLLVQQLEELFESFISVINSAIDEKSPYTGGHCQRVPKLTMMLAEAAEAVTDGPLSGFSMSDEERHALEIASLLHDCGKVTTPVHIVDKATKLQTIFDRIELVDTRFEVIRRDAEIAMLKAVMAGADLRTAEVELSRKMRAMDEARAFLHDINTGSESMHADDVERVRRIAESCRWKNADGEESNLLSDNELENLSVRSGTLTQSERETINYHVEATIKMLEAMPWPRHLRNVPEYACAHHERVDGKGYPRGLRREDMSLQARIMGIADIFEAITARDRPYKSGMKLSEALRVLRDLRDNGHIDPDLYDVFITGRVYLKYGQQFLDPAQVDVTA